MFELNYGKSQLNMLYLLLWAGGTTLSSGVYEIALMTLGASAFLLFMEWGNQIKKLPKPMKIRLFSFLGFNFLISLLVQVNLFLFIVLSIVLFVFWFSFTDKLDSSIKRAE